MTAEDTSRGSGSSESAARPSTVNTPRGLSVLYKGRALYSRYDPPKIPEETARLLAIPEETLILCVSPVLGYGLDILLQKIPESAFVLALEEDENLMALSASHLGREILDHPSFRLIRTSSVARVLETIDSLKVGPFRRSIRLDLSGGAGLNGDFYRDAQTAIDEYISRWWRNQVTLMKLGRNYARNFFANLNALPHAFAIPEHTVAKPVIVAGAGPSLDSSLSVIRERRARVFLLAVDTALPALRDSGITPDAVVLVESQFWITRAFIGFRDSRIPVYADLTANPQALLSTGGKVSFFHTAYAKASFLARFSAMDLSPSRVSPLGSVGLSALEIACFVAAPGFPVLFTGLDFSWGAGFTHSRGSPAPRDALARSCRLEPIERIPSTDASLTRRETGKGGLTVLTDPALAGYAALCAARFGGDSRLFDFGNAGLPTGCRNITEGEVRAILDCFVETKLPDTERFPVDANRLDAYLSDEKTRLREIRGVLTGDSQYAHIGTEGLIERLKASDYLYLHFPDGYKGVNMSDGFLRRVRIELEYFLKTLDRPRTEISFPSS